MHEWALKRILHITFQYCLPTGCCSIGSWSIEYRCVLLLASYFFFLPLISVSFEDQKNQPFREGLRVLWGLGRRQMTGMGPAARFFGHI